MTSPLSPTITITTDRTMSGSSLSSSPYTTDSTPAPAPARTAAQLANLRYKAPRPSPQRVTEDSPIGSASGTPSALSSHPFLPPVSGAGEPSLPPISWDPSTQRYSVVPEATKETDGEGVRAAARVESAAAALFPEKAPRRLSGPFLLAPLTKVLSPLPALDEKKPS